MYPMCSIGVSVRLFALQLLSCSLTPCRVCLPVLLHRVRVRGQNMAAQKIQQFWRLVLTRRKLRVRRKKIMSYQNRKLKQRHLRERTTTRRLGDLSMKRFKRVRAPEEAAHCPLVVL